MNIVIILSGGSGTRLGGETPKQYLVSEGRSMIERAMEPFFLHAEIDAVWIVAEGEWRESILADIGRLATDSGYSGVSTASYGFRRRSPEEILQMRLGFSDPGATRALSILNALRDLNGIASEQDVVIIHDAARPFVSKELISRLIDACQSHDGALPVLPMKDTVYLLPEMAQDVLSSERTLLPRERVVAGQAPEAFRYGKYLAANEALLPVKILEINGSTEVALLAGMRIAVVAGEEDNFKVTTKEDLERYHLELSARGRY